MRAFTQAAALLFVQSVAGEFMQAPVRRVSATETIPTAYITLNVPVDGAETQVVPLRLDLVEAEEPCSPAQVSVNGHRLVQDAGGFGQGALTLDDGITITSNWTFACQSLKQALTIHVHSVNGSPVAGPASLIANFYQTTPVQIASVENVASVRYLHLHTTVTESLADSGEEHSGGVAESYDAGHPVPAFRGSVEEELSRLKELRSQARELAAIIRDQEATVIDQMERKLQAKLAREPAPTPLAECRDVRCAFKALAYRFRHSHEEVCESKSGWRGLFGCAPGEQSWEDVDDADMEYMDDLEWLDDDKTAWEDEETLYASYEEDVLAAHYESTRGRMLMLVAESAIIFGAAVFLITSFLRYLTTGRRLRFRRRRAPSELPLYQDTRYFDEPKTLVSFGFVDDDDASRGTTGYPDDEKAILRAADDKAAGKATVADEIAELRAAASVVSDLVAVDAVERRSSVDYDDEAPPAYERGDEREHSL